LAVHSGNSGKTQVLIIGAGIAGLAAANTATQQGLTVKVIEARGRLGGRINTETVGSNKVEMGAASIYGTGPGCGEQEEWKD
jgi:polyamine oxidase